MSECIIGTCMRPGVQVGPPGYPGRCAEHSRELGAALAAAAEERLRQLLELGGALPRREGGP
jgi:hypothetical protein